MKYNFIPIVLFGILLFKPGWITANSDSLAMINPSFNFEEIVPNKIPLTDEDWDFLKKGKILFRDPHPDLLGGMAIGYTQNTPPLIWSIIMDYDHYVDFIPETLSCQVKEKKGEIFRIDAKYKSIWPFDDVVLESINIHDSSDPNHLRMAWKASHTNMKTASGYWIVQSQKEGVLVVYGMDFDLNWIPRVLAEKSGRQRVKNVLNAVIQRAENSSKKN
jgi:hypothetical protein